MLQVKIVNIWHKAITVSKNACPIYGDIYHPPPKKKEIKPENMHHGLGREFHNIVSGQYEDNNNACLYLQRQ